MPSQDRTTVPSVKGLADDARIEGSGDYPDWSHRQEPVGAVIGHRLGAFRERFTERPHSLMRQWAGIILPPTASLAAVTVIEEPRTE